MTVTIENTYTGNGSTTDYSFTFPYLDTPDIKVSLAGVNTTAYSLLNATTVRFDSAPGNGVAIRIYRETAYTNPKATFYPGSAIRAGDLNDNTLQNLYVTQEANDKVANAWLTGDPTVISTESWYTTDDTKIASTKAIENRINSQIDTALTSDVVAGSSITIADNSPSSGKITVSVNAATTSASGSMSAADKTKLDGIESNATADQTNAEIRAAVEAATDSNVFTDADHTKLNGIETAATADQTDAEIRAAVEAASDSNVFTDADHTKLNGIEASATADQTAAEIKTAYESNAQTNPLTDAEKAVIDGVTANTSELNKLDGVTATTTQLNIVSGKTFRASGDGTLSTTSDTEIPSSKVIATHVASAVSNVGGFVTIANEISFPTTANQPANGVIVSISDAAGTVINGSGVSTTGRTTDGTPATVTINNFPSSLNSETLASGVALLVTSTGSSNTYNYHKILAAETDVKSLSDDINDFNARYRVAGSAPGSNNDDGDLWFDTSANKMKVYNATGSSWDDVASVGQFFINTISSSSGTGGGSATFNGSAYRFTLSNPASGGAQQLLVSVNGVLQKPNTGTSQPSEGFAIDGNDIIFSAAPASGSDYFIVTQGSSVSIGTPSANSVNSSHIIDGSIVNADVSNSANIAGSKVADDSIPEAKLDVHNAPATDKYLKYTSNGMEWSDGASEGTDVKSTGESGTTKFLRVDGDGTSSWQVPPDTVYTHPNHSGEVTSSADGAQTIASNVVDEDNLKVSNSPTNGQFLQAQSGNTGGLTWANVTIPPAGNTVDLVADGAIAAGKPVIITTAGKAQEAKETISARTSAISSTNGRLTIDEDDAQYNFGLVWDELRDRLIASWERNYDGQAAVITVSTALGTNSMSDGPHQSYENSNCNGSALCYDPDTNQYLAVYRAGNQSDYGGSRLGTTSGGSYNSITWGTEEFLNSHRGENYNACYDTTNNKFVVAYYNEDDQRRVYCAVGTVSGTDISWGTPVKLDDNWKVSNDGGTKQLAICYDSNAERVVVAWRQDSNDQGFVAVCTVSGTSISQTGSGTLNAAATDNISCCFDSNANKTIFVYRDEGNSNRTTVRSASISGNTITFGNEAALGGGNPSDNIGHLSGIAFDPATNGFWVAYYNANNFFRASNGIINGTGFTWWTEDMTLTNDGMKYNENRNNVKVCALGSHGKVAIIGSNASQNKDPDIFIIETKSAQSNLTATNSIGFAEDAINDTATGTIKLTGNVVGNQSSLTAGTQYYIQSDGTLGTSQDNTLGASSGSTKAGIALSATSLLIADYRS